MRGSFRIAKIAGVPVGVHWSLLAIGALLSFQLAGGPVADAAGSTALAAVVGVLTAVAFFASILAHEVGHALSARRHGVATEGIDLWALGGVARLAKEPASPRAAWRIAAAGPAVSVLAALLFGGLAFVLRNDDLLSAPFEWLALVNGVVAVFNLVPVAPLDGGRILSAVLWARHGDRARAHITAARGGRALGWVLIGFGAVITLRGGFGLFPMMLGLFLLMSSKAEEASAHVHQALDGIRVRELTWFGLAHAPATTDVDTMLLQRDRMGAVDVVAVDDERGALAGIVTGVQLAHVAYERRLTTTLGELALPAALAARAEPDELLVDTLGRLNPLSPFITVWDAGRLVGLVRQEQVRDRLRRVPEFAGMR